LSSDEADELEGNLLRFQPELPDDDFKPLEPVEDFEQGIIRNWQSNSITSESVAPCSITPKDFQAIAEQSDVDFTLSSEIDHLIESIRTIARDLPDVDAEGDEGEDGHDLEVAYQLGVDQFMGELRA